MNKNLYRTQFAQMETTEKQALMESLAVRYTMTFFGLHTFDRWGQSCTTSIFEKDGREFVFVPGDTITLGWEQFAHGTESGEPGGIGVSVPGMGNGAGPGRTHWREHGSRPASGHRPHAGRLGPFLGFLPCSPHCKPEVQEDNERNGDYDFYRPIIRVKMGV